MQRKTPRFSSIELSMLIIFSILLILVGCGLLLNEFRHYHDIVADNQDTYLINSVRYIDRNLSMQLDTYQRELEHVVNRQVFQSDADEWRATGRSDGLIRQMQSNLLYEDDAITTMLVIQDGAVTLSTDGMTDYILPCSMPDDEVFPVISPSGVIHLGLSCTQGDMQYVMLVDLAHFFLQMHNALPVDTDRLFLLHADRGYFFHYWKDQVRITPIAALGEHHPDASVLLSMLQAEEKQSPLTVSYEHIDSEITITERLAVLPVQLLTNGQLTIGLTVDYGNITAPLYQSMEHVLFLGTGTMIAVALLMFATIYAAMSSARRNRELEELQQKNEEMTKLTEKTLSLYHHQRLETIGTLTSSIAHEFGNLLTPIMGYSIMTMEALPPECDELADYLQEIYDASCSAKTIISRLNDLSRKNTGTSYVYISPDDLVRRMTGVTMPIQPENVSAELHLNAPGLYLHGNETQLTQLLLNLILNAYHAMKETGGVVTISTSAEGKLLRIRVQDTGKGIPPENIDKIFDPFFTTRESGKGTGLGLPISLQVAREHGGDIAVSSKVGEGSTFDVLLPLSDPPPEKD